MRKISRSRLLTTVLAGGGLTYAQRVLATSPIAYWPLDETSGTTAKNYGSIASGDGTYSGVTLANTAAPGGGLAPSFDGTNDFVDVYSAALNTAWNGNEGSMMFWFKVYAADAWTEGAVYFTAKIRADNSNEIVFTKSATANLVRFACDIGADTDVEDVALSSTDWVQIFFTWSKAAGEKKYYINGALQATDVLGAVDWAGALLSDACLFGAFESDNPTVAKPFRGWMAQCGIWATPLSITTIQTLYNSGL